MAPEALNFAPLLPWVTGSGFLPCPRPPLLRMWPGLCHLPHLQSATGHLLETSERRVPKYLLLSDFVGFPRSRFGLDGGLPVDILCTLLRSLTGDSLTSAGGPFSTIWGLFPLATFHRAQQRSSPLANPAGESRAWRGRCSLELPRSRRHSGSGGGRRGDISPELSIFLLLMEPWTFFSKHSAVSRCIIKIIYLEKIK